MSPSRKFPARASPSYEGSEATQAELGHFNFWAENELDFFSYNPKISHFKKKQYYFYSFLLQMILLLLKMTTFWSEKKNCNKKWWFSDFRAESELRFFLTTIKFQNFLPISWLHITISNQLHNFFLNESTIMNLCKMILEVESYDLAT